MVMNILLVVQFLMALGLIIVVLLQADKGTGLSGAFGGGAGHTKFGLLSGGTPLGKATVILGVFFIVNSIFMAYLARSGANNMVKPDKSAVEQHAPASTIPGMPPLPTPGADIPAGAEVPAGESKVPAGESKVPAGESEVPAGESESATPANTDSK